MKHYSKEIGVFFTLVGGIASLNGFLLAADSNLLWQFALAYYVFGLVAMVAFSFFMKRLHNHDKHTLVTNLVFSVFAAPFWWAMWGIGIEDWLKAKKDPPKLNGNHA